MKRKLNKEETRMTKKGIKLRTERLKDITRLIEFTEDSLAYKKKWGSYLDEMYLKEQTAKEKALENQIKSYQEQLEHELSSIKIEESYLKDGVEIKETKKPVGVQ